MQKQSEDRQVSIMGISALIGWNMILLRVQENNSCLAERTVTCPSNNEKKINMPTAFS